MGAARNPRSSPQSLTQSRQLYAAHGEIGGRPKVLLPVNTTCYSATWSAWGQSRRRPNVRCQGEAVIAGRAFDAVCQEETSAGRRLLRCRDFRPRPTTGRDFFLVVARPCACPCSAGGQPSRPSSLAGFLRIIVSMSASEIPSLLHRRDRRLDAVGVHHVAALAEVGGDQHAFRAELL